MRKLMILAAAGLSLSGCASVTRGTTEQIQFDSVPTGVEVRTTILPGCDADCMERNYTPEQGPNSRKVDAEKPKPGPSCVTPCVATVARRDVMVANFIKPGFETQTVRIEPKLAQTGAMGFAGNLVVGGAAGMVVDAASGATLDHCPNPVSVVMRKAGSRDPVTRPNLQCAPPPVADQNAPRADRQTN